MTDGSPFFALLLRMKHIHRWALMRSNRAESLSAHALETAVIAHALATIDCVRFGASCNADRAAAIALYHDASEVLTGDMPTPVKYHSPELRAAYAAVENAALERLMSLLPPDLRAAYAPYLGAEAADAPLYRYVKAADKLSALIKCVEEEKSGNAEFSAAKRSLLRAVQTLDMPSVDVFLAEFLPAFGDSVDGLLF